MVNVLTELTFLLDLNTAPRVRIGVRATHLTKIENECTCEMCSPDTYLLFYLETAFNPIFQGALKTFSKI